MQRALQCVKAQWAEFYGDSSLPVTLRYNYNDPLRLPFKFAYVTTQESMKKLEIVFLYFER